MTEKKILALIPARGGSKEIPRKNIVPFGGKPLIAWTIEAALASRGIARTVVSTDDEEIAVVARKSGAEVPFLRPADFAGDEAPALGVIRHALGVLAESGERYDAVAYLQPTSPLRGAGDIEAALALLEETGADTVVSVVPVPHAMVPSSLMRQKDGGRLDFAAAPETRKFRRQDKERLFARNGPAILLSRISVFETGALYGAHIRGLEMHPFRSVDIDDADDLALAEAMIPLAAKIRAKRPAK